MIDRRVSIAVVGGGEGAAKALGAIQGVTRAHVCAVVCQDHELQGQVSSDVRVSTLRQVLLNDSVEAVYVATPVGSHIALACQSWGRASTYY